MEDPRKVATWPITPDHLKEKYKAEYRWEEENCKPIPDINAKDDGKNQKYENCRHWLVFDYEAMIRFSKSDMYGMQDDNVYAECAVKPVAH